MNARQQTANPGHSSGTRRIRGVVFDFDGVIVDTEWAVYQAWQEVFAAHGGELPLELYSQCVGSDHGAWDPKAYFEETLGLRPDWPSLLDPKNQRTRELLAGQGPMPGVVDWITRLYGRGIPLAVASSSSRDWVGGWLRELELDSYFHSLHCRDDVARVKPSPELYLRAAAALEIEPTELLAIEDSANGARAAVLAGMRVIAVPNPVTWSQDFTGTWRVEPSLAGLDFAVIEPLLEMP